MRFAFISIMELSPWGGSEELWSQTALRLVSKGHSVSALIKGWKDSQWNQRVQFLEKEGVNITPRVQIPTVRKLAADRLRARLRLAPKPDPYVEFLHKSRPDFVVISHGCNFNCDPYSFIDACIEQGIPYATISQMASEIFWPSDADFTSMQKVFANARAAYFVSQANLEVTRLQAAVDGRNFCLVRNPFNVRYDARPAWKDETGGYHLAFVGRHDPGSKGCDLLLRVLSTAEWRERAVTMNFYGSGSSERQVKAMATLLGVKVNFHGQASDIEKVWENNHLLVLPSRFEGLPLAVVEAMLCGRTCVVTDVAGNAEMIEDNETGFVAQGPSVRCLGEALERAWTNRTRWKEMGMKAASMVRTLVPSDPAATFADELLKIASVFKSKQG